MQIATLFSGIGSPEQAARRVHPSHNIVFACEIDKFARQSYLANYTISQNHFHEDINKLNASKYRNKVDILIGGSPCQSFSLAGLRKGVEDARGSLIYQYIRIVSECMPKVIIYENVPGIKSIDDGETIKDFIASLQEIGYHCHHGILNTKDYGVPQNRKRFFLVGFLNSNDYFNFDFANPFKLEKKLSDLLEENVDEEYYLTQKQIGKFQNAKYRHRRARLQVKEYCRTMLHTDDKNPLLIKVGILGVKGHDSSKRVYSLNGISPTLTTMQGGGRVPNIAVAAKKVKGTITLDGAKWNVRKITPRECLRLQDFDDSFKIVVSDSQAYKQAGNSMSVNVVEMILRQIEKAQNGISQRGKLF